MFVGRDDELRELGDAIATANARGTYVALVGEPGIGKTRLAEEAAVLACGAGYRVAWGRCWEAGGAPPLWPWIEALRELGVADGWERAGGEQFAVFDNVMRALRRSADAQPITIILDDLHAADHASLLLLQFVARHLPFAKLLVIATYRDVEARLRDVTALLAKPAREGKTLMLDRLGRDDVAKLAADRTDPDALFRSSEGNPLFVQELLRLGERRGDVIPGGIHSVISERLALVDPATRRAVQIASVIGRDFDADIVGALGGGGFDAAVRAGLVVAAGDRFRFSHVRIRDVLYDELADKAALHVAAAGVLEARGADPSAIAHHWFAAGDDRAIDAAVRAADVASQHLAFTDAAALLERAHARAAPARRDELAIALGTALIRAGRHDEGQRLCVAAARSQDPVLVARAALAYGLVYRFGKSDATLVALLEAALAQLPAGDTPLRAQLLGRLAGALQPANDLAVPVAAARSAIELARRLGDPPTLASVLVSAGSAMQDVVDAGERLPNNEALVRLAAASGDTLLVARGQLRLAFDHLELGNVEAADGAFRTHAELIAEHTNPRLHWPSALYRALRADMAGRFAEADDHVAQARRLAGRADDAAARITIAMHAVCTALVRDAFDELHAAEPLLADHAYHPAVQQFLGALLACRLGRVQEARARVASTPFSSWYRQSSGATIMAEISAVACPDAGVYDDIAPFAERGRVGIWSMTAVVSLGPVARPASLLAAALDRWDDAERFAREAQGAALAQVHLPVLARTRFEWGSALLRRGKPEGRALVEEARETAEAFGMTALVAACRGNTAPSVPVPRAVVEEAARLAIERDGDSWQLRWANDHVRVRDSRGMHMIAELVARAGDDVHVLDLSGGGVVDGGDAGEVLDRTAIETYKRRILDLTSELEEAEDNHDLGRGERLREELDALEDEVSRAVGLGGRARRSASNVERARINVQRRIKAAIAQVEKLSAPLGKHLAKSVRTGSFCSYVARPA